MVALSMETEIEATECDPRNASKTRFSIGTPFTGSAHLWLTP
jgi:hypothetical protein